MRVLRHRQSRFSSDSALCFLVILFLCLNTGIYWDIGKKGDAPKRVPTLVEGKG